MHCFIYWVKFSGISGLATISRNTKNSPLVRAPEYVWQHNFQAFDRLLLCPRFLHKVLTSPPSIFFPSVLSFPQRDSNYLNFIVKALSFSFGFYANWGGKVGVLIGWGGIWTGFTGASNENKAALSLIGFCCWSGCRGCLTLSWVGFWTFISGIFSCAGGFYSWALAKGCSRTGGWLTGPSSSSD